MTTQDNPLEVISVSAEELSKYDSLGEYFRDNHDPDYPYKMAKSDLIRLAQLNPDAPLWLTETTPITVSHSPDSISYSSSQTTKVNPERFKDESGEVNWEAVRLASVLLRAELKVNDGL